MKTLIRVYLTPDGKPFAVMDSTSLVGKMGTIIKIHASLKNAGYTTAEFVTLELEE